MNSVLWIAQVLLAVIFLVDGSLKILKPETMKAQGLGEVGLLLFIGVSEILGAGGLLLPQATRLFPWLTPLSALGIAAIMVLAARFRLRRHEIRAAGVTFILMSLSLFVACGRIFLSASA